ncbi:MAG: hypothetical protein M1826_003440 [Phylliscum demangeonii]|nr:MAG: hypothetical protein M1826_003440 [Phylliscum demangeonii]
MINDLEPAIAAMKAAAYLSDRYKAITSTPLETKDRRVLLLKTSLSYLMLRVSGVIPGHNTDLEHLTYTTFRDGYHQFGEGEHKREEQATTFAQQVKDLCEYTLSTCDVVITTCSNTAEAYLAQSFSPDVVYINEATKATELDLVIPMAHYNAQVIILAGDDQQLCLTVLTNQVKDDMSQLVNCFAPQLTRSPFNRFRYLGLPVILLREQFRMTAGLSRPASRISYKNWLIDAEGTALTARPQSRMFLRWTQAKYPEIIGTMPALLLNVHKSLRSSVGKSAMNLHTAGVGVNTVISLLEFGFPAKDIAVIVFYQAQSKTYKVVLRLASQALHSRTLQDVRVKKVDGYQGGEASVVILDFAITAIPGFVRDRNHANKDTWQTADLAINLTITPVTTTTTTTTTTDHPEQASVKQPAPNVQMTEADQSQFLDGNDVVVETGDGSGHVRDDYMEAPTSDTREQPGSEAKEEEQSEEEGPETTELDESTESESTTERAQQDKSAPMDETE